MRLPIFSARIRRQLEYLRGYASLDRHGGELVPRTELADCERPVLLLYGMPGTRRVFQTFEKQLSRDGFGVCSINFGGLFDRFNTRSIDECAELLAEEVERLHARERVGPLAIIGHSLGGLVGRYYVKRLGGDRRVRTLITLGTPHHGTATAYLGAAAMGLVSKSIWQVTPMSTFIRRLKIGRMPASVRTVSVYSKADRVCPFPSCILETDGWPNLFNVEVPGVGHGEFLVKRRVYEIVRRELELGERNEDDEDGATVTRIPHLVSR